MGDIPSGSWTPILFVFFLVETNLPSPYLAGPMVIWGRTMGMYPQKKGGRDNMLWNTWIGNLGIWYVLADQTPMFTWMTFYRAKGAAVDAGCVGGSSCSNSLSMVKLGESNGRCLVARESQHLGHLSRSLFLMNFRPTRSANAKDKHILYRNPGLTPTDPKSTANPDGICSHQVGEQPSELRR